jgi:hypothetical protein
VSDVWFRAGGRRLVLGHWPIPWGQGAGTFANRNHFANWAWVASLAVLGGALRAYRPLHAARLGPVPARQVGMASSVLWMAVGLGVLAAGASGSRAGLAAGMAGACAWALLLARRAHQKDRWLLLTLWGVVVLAAAVLAGGELMHRLRSVSGDLLRDYPKLDLWRGTLRMAGLFPLFGVGWGGFAAAFNHIKLFGGGLTFWHAEQDWLQLLAETGLAGAAIFCAVLIRLLWRPVRVAWDMRERIPEPELLFGALAGLAAFGAHGALDFVFQIPANALLAAALLGVAAGAGARPRGARALVPNAGPRRRAVLMAAGCALAIASLAQSWAAWRAHQAGRLATTRDIEPALRHITSAQRWWPFGSGRALVRARLDAARAARLPPADRTVRAAGARAALDRSLALDPMNWELRMERVWLSLECGGGTALAIDQAREAVRLNPLQPRLPLAFARLFAARDPGAARDFVRAAAGAAAADRAGGGGVAVQREVLACAWDTQHDAGFLWSLTPATEEGLRALAEFAVGVGLDAVAAQARQRLGAR